VSRVGWAVSREGMRERFLGPGIMDGDGSVPSIWLTFSVGLLRRRLSVCDFGRSQCSSSPRRSGLGGTDQGTLVPSHSLEYVPTVILSLPFLTQRLSSPTFPVSNAASKQ